MDKKLWLTLSEIDEIMSRIKKISRRGRGIFNKSLALVDTGWSWKRIEAVMAKDNEKLTIELVRLKRMLTVAQMKFLVQRIKREITKVRAGGGSTRKKEERTLSRALAILQWICTSHKKKEQSDAGSWHCAVCDKYYHNPHGGRM